MEWRKIEDRDVMIFFGPNGSGPGKNEWEFDPEKERWSMQTYGPQFQLETAEMVTEWVKETDDYRIAKWWSWFENTVLEQTVSDHPVPEEQITWEWLTQQWKEKADSLDQINDDLVNEICIIHSGGYLGVYDSESSWWIEFFRTHPSINQDLFAEEIYQFVGSDELMDMEDEIRGYPGFVKVMEIIADRSKSRKEGHIAASQKRKTENRKAVRETASEFGGHLYLIPFHHFYGGDENNIIRVPFTGTDQEMEKLESMLYKVQVLPVDKARECIQKGSTVHEETLDTI